MLSYEHVLLFCTKDTINRKRGHSLPRHLLWQKNAKKGRNKEKKT